MGTPAIYNLDHLGVVAGIIDDIDLVSLVDEHVGDDRPDGLSTGLVVKAMLLNSLGMVSAPLYLFSQFFEGKATEHLLGEGIHPAMLNDDRLGRALDRLWQWGLNDLFMRVALHAVKHYGVEVSRVHLDSTSMAVEGAYRSALADAPAASASTIRICHGYSRDHRPDLKQFMMNLISTGDHGIPLMLSMADGNQVDSQVLGELMTRFAQQWTFDGIHVADAALYRADNLEPLGSLQWVTRVPLRLAAASALLDEIHPSSFVPSRVVRTLR
ncbi:MAG: IS1634 family transposase [Cyanothece sp. SIO2G6]|nr:IS1634 family transposase [Cyanothece sp. SIO2G6]